MNSRERRLLLAGLILATGAAGFHAAWKTSIADRIPPRPAHSDPRLQWIGRHVPDFALPLTNGETFRLSEAVGRHVLVLLFFRTEHDFAAGTLTELSAYHERHVKEGVRVVGIAGDPEPGRTLAFLAKHPVRFPVGVDTNQTAAAAIDAARHYATAVVIGGDGRIDLYEQGAVPNAEVVLGPTVQAQVRLLRERQGIGAAEYLAAVSNQAASLRPKAPSRPSPPPEPVLQGEARAFGDRMKCPSCGRSMNQCSCGLCGAVRGRLAKLSVTNRTDEQILRDLFLEARAP